MGIEIPATNTLAGQIKPPEFHFSDQTVNSHDQVEDQGNRRDFTKKEIAVVMDALIASASILNRKLKYVINEEIGCVVVQVIDAETDKVIKEIPPREIQRLIARIKETLGLLVDEKI